jgi:hypothetical protein
VTDGGTGWTAGYDGTFVQDDAEGWLGAWTSGSLALSGDDGGVAPALVLDGGVGAGGRAAWFEGWAAGGEGCDGAYAGRVQVRMADGAWIDLDYGDACAPCAAASLDGVDLGTACPDLAPAVDALAASRSGA